MDDGDNFRQISGRGDAMILLAISKIREIRPKENPGLTRQAYILHSLKHPDEVKLLRQVYGDAFVAVSVYMPKAERQKKLAERFSRSHNQFDPHEFEHKAKQLIDRDEKVVGEKLGQNVRGTFPEADMFLDAGNPTLLSAQVKRFIEILFRHPNKTPTIDEYGLFHAKAAALRSADLSRQVGAVITTRDGEIVAAGCNEVPLAGGGAFWEASEVDPQKDRRDFVLGYDPNSKMKHEILKEVFTQLQKSNWLRKGLLTLSADELVGKALDDAEPILAQTRIASIIEFGRIVHAEMFALTEAARRGLSVKGTTIYCTTFPCHMCARHLLASGIKRVVYIEPYPKSLAKDLYEGAINVDHDPNADSDAVMFVPFVGVSPRRYIKFFEMPERKDARGLIKEWKPLEAVPRVEQFATYLDAETTLVEQLEVNKFDWGLVQRDLLIGETE